MTGTKFLDTADFFLNLGLLWWNLVASNTSKLFWHLNFRTAVLDVC